MAGPWVCRWLCVAAGVGVIGVDRDHPNRVVAAQQAVVEFASQITALRGDCPAVTFEASGTTVMTSTATEFDGLSCLDLRDGLSVEVEGSQQPDGSIVAAEVESHYQGTVRSVRGICPSLTFEIGGLSVVTDEGTDFDGIRCLDLQEGVTVEVDGATEPNGVLAAEEVESADDDDENDDGDDDRR